MVNTAFKDSTLLLCVPVFVHALKKFPSSMKLN